ncbi:unnamed protein product [Penicillium nalgiovense]|uniref:DUF7580 domain-containing protein n=1 Tax=Penicillium nalgiovense TaxID=60175 RepID=A0A9W4MR20_PENNA|nr:unnamed protein product [Penicillium nalgiovense]CAG7977906.1 unnamed protein product [Penicillium nalgiovense]CAG7991868.1 unnamed protein product [Penicillium nalgiovense]CAG7992004.1 unnamed protein product [Penicillium nalgiovense]CAG8001057.1 unnamed protein product [Penicillium nalgiovense]
MVTGVEAAGLALAILPLLINQIDAYALGIEKIRLLRRYRRDFKGYSMGLKTQRTILLNTLEQALEGVVDDEDEIRQLINNPQGEVWANAALQRRLRRKLNRNYDVFLQNMTSLSDLLEYLSQKLHIGEDWANVSDLFIYSYTICRVYTHLGSSQSAPETWDLWKFRKILSKAVYDDLLAKINAANTILKLLIDQSDQREASKKRRQSWSPLLQQYKKARKHAEGLFQTIIDGNYWRCGCKGQHCIQLQLQANPLGSAEDHPLRNCQSQFRMLFSNKAPSNTNTDRLLTWTEMVFKPMQVKEATGLATLSLYDNPTFYQVQGRSRVQCNGSTLIEEASEMTLEPPSIPPIQDFCSSLHFAEMRSGQQKTIGFIANEMNTSFRYTMDAVRLPKGVPQKPLEEVLSKIGRRDRLHIATGLACGAVQFCGNWLKSSWDSSDVHLAAADDGYSVLLDKLYLSWPLLSPNAGRESCNSKPYPRVQNNPLLPLGLALVELSLGKSLSVFFTPEDEHQEPLVTKFRVASRLVDNVHQESGTHYAEAVHSCLYWSGITSLCNEQRFVERVFDNIVSPLLKDLVNFEGLT